MKIVRKNINIIKNGETSFDALQGATLMRFGSSDSDTTSSVYMYKSSLTYYFSGSVTFLFTKNNRYILLQIKIRRDFTYFSEGDWDITASFSSLENSKHIVSQYYKSRSFPQLNHFVQTLETIESIEMHKSVKRFIDDENPSASISVESESSVILYCKDEKIIHIEGNSNSDGVVIRFFQKGENENAIE
ncbi:MAG: hypothetical protein H6577_13130 [Lewinellaceae bacterium]|nr:hypothetical protein [Saprospiraceae bacterium]MCB9339067.1 hypothetical protein [Lewinellaceae bacterium]